jgi:hypothetical protein
MIYAWGPGGTLDYHGPVQYGAFKMEVDQEARVVNFLDSNITTEVTHFFFIHGV